MTLAVAVEEACDAADGLAQIVLVRQEDDAEVGGLLPPWHVLIVDDEPMALYSTAHAFPWADWGFDPPVLMTEAPAALDNLRTERFDAAIVDIRMPQMTGIDLIRLSGEAGLQTVFIVLSGYSDFSYVQTALRL